MSGIIIKRTNGMEFCKFNSLSQTYTEHLSSEIVHLKETVPFWPVCSDLFDMYTTLTQIRVVAKVNYPTVLQHHTGFLRVQGGHFALKIKKVHSQADMTQLTGGRK